MGCPSAVAFLVSVMLGIASAPAPAAAVQAGAGILDLGMESRASVHLDPHGSGSSGDAIATTVAHAETEGIKARKSPRRNNRALPRGYEKELKIAVPMTRDSKTFVNTTNKKVTGYCIDVFEAAVKKLPHDLHYEFVVFIGSYDELIGNVSLWNFDAVVGDVTITAERASYVDFTMPYTESGVSLLVLTENDSMPTIEWVFLKPLTTELWIATVGGFFLTGLVVWMIERPKNLEYQGSSSRQCSTALYFSFSTLTFSHGQIIRSPLSKVVVVIWCFVVLVLVQSYTASLSSLLTAKRLRPSVTDLEQLLLNGDYVGYPSGPFMHSILTKQGFTSTSLKPYIKKEEYAEALRKGSKNGGVSAIVDEIPYITDFLSDPQYQNEFEMVKRIYRTPGFGFVFPQHSPLVHDLSIAILDLSSWDEGSRIEAKWLLTAASLPCYGIPIADSSPLTLRSFSGLFIITGCISALMLLIRIARLVHAQYTQVRDSDQYESTNGDGESEGHGEPCPVQSSTGNGSVTDQPHHDVRNGGSEVVQERGGSACDVEPSQMQNNIHNNSGPAQSVQIQMNAA